MYICVAQFLKLAHKFNTFKFKIRVSLFVISLVQVFFSYFRKCVNIVNRPNSVKFCGRLRDIYTIPITVQKWVRDASICSLRIRYPNTEAYGCNTIRYIGFCREMRTFMLVLVCDVYILIVGTMRGKINRDGDDASNTIWLYIYMLVFLPVMISGKLRVGAYKRYSRLF